MDATPETVPELVPIRPDEDFDHRPLELYLRERLEGIEGIEGPMEVLQFPGGHSNLTYLVRFGETEYVVRRPPLGPIPPKAHDMGREYAVLSKLYRAYPAAPRAYLFCEDPEIIGAPFCVLERCKGLIIRNAWPEQLGEDPALARRISQSLVDALAELHRVDYKAIGLGDLGRPEGFLERQVRGWAGRWERAKIDELPILDELVKRLLDEMPESGPYSIIHNDYKLDNLMLAQDDPGRIVAILDWEMCTLGDPMIDLGTLLSYWTRAERRGTPDASGDAETDPLSHRITPTTYPGFLSRDEVIRRYGEKTGFDVSRANYFEAFGLFKMAVVLQQIYVRFARGQTRDKRFESLGVQVEPLIVRARNVLQG